MTTLNPPGCLKSVEEYVSALKNGDHAAFDALYRLYIENLYAFIISITRDKFMAEEITQVVFAKVWEKRAEISEHYSFKSWLFTLTFNETISQLRKATSEKTKIRRFHLDSVHSTNETEYMIEFRNLETLSQTIIDRLPEKRRQIFKMSREQGLSNQDIASELGLSVKTVENQMSSALKQIRKELGRGKILNVFFYFMSF